jgi:cobalt/nickel transport system ATP-binding protein
VVRLKGITYAYPDRPPVLKDLDFSLWPEDRVGLLAPNGSGKTTLFHIIMGLTRPQSGTIELFGEPAASEKDFVRLRPRIGLLFQDPDDQLFSPTVLEDVAFGPLNLGKSRDEAIDISRLTLARLGLEGFEDRITFKLSGGEKRLVSLATVLAMAPEILLLDEPSTGLDQSTKLKLIDILKNLDIAYVLISHEFDFLSETTNTVYGMEDGKILTDEEIYIHRHEHAHRMGRMPHKHI